MRRTCLYVTLIATLAFCGSIHAAMDESAPDEQATRKKIDQLIKRCVDGKKRVTLGMLSNAIALSISYGAPTYNLGDRMSCFKFYAKTAQSLCAAFPDQTGATEAAWGSLKDLQAALDRSRKSADVDKNAWSMRYAFDKNNLALGILTEHLQALVHMGDECFKRGQYEESEDAYKLSVAMLAETDGQEREDVPISCRYARVALGHALFAQKKYKDASATLVSGLPDVPEWPGLTFDLRGLHKDPAEYEEILGDLEAQVKKSPDDAQLQFLLGYEYFYTGKRTAAKEALSKAQKLQPDHDAARTYLRKLETMMKPALEEPPAMKRDDGAR
jgi:tetratricopeptide (TPR) repeat protein